MRCHPHLRHSNFLALRWLLFSHILVYFLCTIVQLRYLQDYLDLGHVVVTETKTNIQLQVARHQTSQPCKLNRYLRQTKTEHKMTD